jgi:hypothetical protein
MGLVKLKNSRMGADPSYVRLESIYPELMELQSLETELWNFFALRGSLDSTALRQRCEESIRSETSSDARARKREWLRSLDRLYHLQKEKVDILSDLTEKYESYTDMKPVRHMHVNTHCCLWYQGSFFVEAFKHMGSFNWHQRIQKDYPSSWRCSRRRDVEGIPRSRSFCSH